MTIQPNSFQSFLTLSRYPFPSYSSGPSTWKYGRHTMVTGFYQPDININDQGQLSRVHVDMDEDGDMYITDEFNPEIIGLLEPLVQGPHHPPLQGPEEADCFIQRDLQIRDDSLLWGLLRDTQDLVEDFFNMDEFGLVPTP